MGLFGHAPLAAGNLQNKPEPEPTLRLLSRFITLIIVTQKEEYRVCGFSFQDHFTKCLSTVVTSKPCLHQHDIYI